MRVDVTAMKNFPSNLGSLLARARSRARVSSESASLIGSSILSSLHPDDWPFSDINSPSRDWASETGESRPLPRSTVPMNSWAEWIPRWFSRSPAPLFDEEDHHGVAKHPSDSCGRRSGRADVADGCGSPDL